jgi:D-alanyl-lipoteichoic acid acyltransferase DltB (MBOAT superfamily)
MATSSAATVTPTAAPRETDPRATRAGTNPVKFAAILAQLALLMWAFVAFQVEERAFMRLALVLVAGFTVHYWLPFRWKEPAWIAVSLAGALALLGTAVTALLVVVGLGLFSVLASARPYRTKIWVIVGLVVTLLVMRGINLPLLPSQFWAVLGALFMFRIVIYLYDLRQMKASPSLREFFVYFYPLPNFYFLLFPVIDYQTQRRTFYQRDIHEMAQQGIAWMVRGTLHLLAYRLIYQFKPPFTAEEVTSFAKLVEVMVMTYLLYLRVSGQFHLIVGMMHLFGYDLPETNHKYLLAHSLTDFWRRINIYWKDFMVKVVYFPMYFRLRKSGDLRAKVLATLAVFLTTWLLHAYQGYWLQGEVRFSWPDTLFWSILGALVMVNIVFEHRAGARGKSAAGRTRILRAVQVAGTFVLITTLWSLWNAPSVEEWFEVLSWWRLGS